MCTLAFVNGLLLGFVGLHKKISSSVSSYLSHLSATKFDLNKNFPQNVLSIFVFIIGRKG